MWDSRLDWSGETPVDFDGLGLVALQRFQNKDGDDFDDLIDDGHVWHGPDFSEHTSDNPAGPWGRAVAINLSDPASEQDQVRLPYFSGLWPSSGRLLVGLWVRQSYEMTYNPILSTRGGSSPLVYLSTYTTGTPRQGVYDSSGSLVLDEYEEDVPWRGTSGWQWLGQLIDFDNQTSQVGSVHDHEFWLGPARSLSGAPNDACTADLDVFSLQTASFWTGGNMDEIIVAHPSSGFDFEGFLQALRLGTWGDAADSTHAGDLDVSDSGVTASATVSFSTGARAVSWGVRPVVSASVPVTAQVSTDDGDSWSVADPLPGSFDGLLRWDVDMSDGKSFTGVELESPPPELDPIADVTVEQRGQETVALSGSWDGSVSWSVAADGVSAVVDGMDLLIDASFQVGEFDVEVTVTDAEDRSASQSFTVTVEASEWDRPVPPQYPRTPIVLWDDDGPAAAVIDAVEAVVVKEVNGELTFTFKLPVGHPAAGLIVNERVVEVAGERYRVRRAETSRDDGVPVVEVYCEARFYDLAYAGQVEAREWKQTTAGAAIEETLADTDWSLGVANVTTLRTYSIEDASPLSVLRTIQDQHGGDLVFDNHARTVSLVTDSGRDNGVVFFYGRGLTESKRVVDTGSLVTRIYARNADGVTIERVNEGKPYVEDFTWTSEVRSAVYDFKEGTSPYTMLSMASATLADRSKPVFSYEFTVADMSTVTGQAVDRFDAGDRVSVVDEELGIRETQRVLKLEYDILRPWDSKVTLSAKLRELGSSDATDAGVLTTGSGSSTLDLVPLNLLKNARFDNDLAHWASSGVTVVDGDGTGGRSVRFEGSGERWVEQTVSADRRDQFAVSLDVDSSGGPEGFVPDLVVEATVVYEDDSEETIPIDLA